MFILAPIRACYEQTKAERRPAGKTVAHVVVKDWKAKMHSIIHHWVLTPDHHLSVHRYCLLSTVPVTSVVNPQPSNIRHACT